MGFWIAVACAVIVLPLYWQRRSIEQKAGPAKAKQLFDSANAESYVRPPYRAVSIKCGELPCMEVRVLGNVRYLVDDAPALPLEGCSADKCTCRYEHHLDRRSSSQDRRHSREATAEESAQAGAYERRQSASAGRRATDQKRSAAQ